MRNPIRMLCNGKGLLLQFEDTSKRHTDKDCQNMNGSSFGLSQNFSCFGACKRAKSHFRTQKS